MGLSRYSVLAVNWVRFPGGDEDVSEPTPAWPLEKVLDAAADAGFAAVGLDHYTVGAYIRDGGRVEDLAALLETRGLRCTDVGVVPIGGDGPATHELAELAAVTGAKLAIAAFYGPATPDEAIRDLRAAADVLAPAGVRIALEFTAYGQRRSLRDGIQLCEAVGWPGCGLLVDTWHIFRGGEDLAELRALDAEQIALVHVNDGAPASDVDRVFEGRFRRLPPGAGTFALDEFTAALDAIGYGGPISVEVLSTALRQLPPAEGARQLLESLEA